MANITLTITINTDNESFKGNPGREAARILRESVEKIIPTVVKCDIGDYENRKPLDTNGNSVGKITLTIEE